MVRNKINDDFESGLVSPPYKCLKFLHSVFRILGQICIHVIIVANGIGRTGLTFHKLRM